MVLWSRCFDVCPGTLEAVACARANNTHTERGLVDGVTRELRLCSRLRNEEEGYVAGFVSEIAKPHSAAKPQLKPCH